jgi:hypothetical protein
MLANDHKGIAVQRTRALHIEIAIMLLKRFRCTANNGCLVQQAVLSFG